jgi:two-component system, chemotaxis family, CheB/CheR fusion protein
VRQALTVAETNRKPDFYVVGIGASAGGLEALRTFFSRMPAEPGFACVVVVHLSPEHESHLVPVLQPYCQMPVCQVVRTTALEPNRVYVIPPNANLNSIDTHLRLSELETRRLERAPIDHFLRTLAETHGETAIGVILTGAGSDGALGIRQIKEHGGLTIAQDPREAESASMPQSAIATGTVDLVLSLRDMAEEIIGFCQTRVSVSAPGDDEPLSDDEAGVVEKILGEVRLRTGQEFAMYRRGLLLQRVRHRMRLRRVPKLSEYFEVLRDQPDEPRALYNDLLLHVTEFFRDAETYRTLARVIDEILERQAEQEMRARVWSIGCSTGEEAYSLAMLLIEQASRRGERPSLQVFASELSPSALQQAREGIYPQEVAGAISPERLERFFVNENGRYRVRNELRDVVTFASHDLFEDPPYAHLDLIVCRSLLQNLRPEMRSAVLSLFYYALEPHGILFIDPLDGLETPALFTRDGANPRLLRRVSGPTRAPQLPAQMKPFARWSGERAGQPVARQPYDAASIFRSAIERYLPPSVLIDSGNRVVHFSSTASRYIRIPGGELTLDILKLVSEPIGYRLTLGLQAVREGLPSWQSEPFAVDVAGRSQQTVMRVDRAGTAGRSSDLLLVAFDAAAAARRRVGNREEGALEQVIELENELARVQKQLIHLSARAASAPGERRDEGDPEKLRELVEELENAHEELQTVNEELVSLNEENHHRLETLTQVSNDLQHLLESTGLATLLVDRALNVVRFTPLLHDVVHIQESDVGRPLGDLNHNLRYPALGADLRRVVRDLAEIELEVESHDGRWYLLRMQPYRTALRGLEGAVLVLIDITDRKNAELTLRETDRRKDEFLAVLAHELRNPLAPIGAGIEVLRKIPDDAKLVRQVVATMGRQSQQLVRLVDDLLEVSRISGGKLTLRIAPTALAEVVRDAVAAVRPFLETLRHELTVAVPPERLVIDGDATRLTQVIGNLLHNAGRYTPAGGRISLVMRRVEDKAEITIRDNGLGISAHSLPNVFDMFYQASEPGTVNNAGLGIGLTLARKLVEMHAGTIRAESAGSNMGSTFTVCLPLANVALDSGVTDVQAQAGPAVEGRRVLIVDDNSDAAETLRLLMTTMGSGEVRTASNGPEALTVGAQLRPDLVLLDLGMPGMDGYEVARRMRGESWGKEALLVALTGWGQDQHRHRSKEAGFDRHMTKPADPEALRAVLMHAPAH